MPIGPPDFMRQQLEDKSAEQDLLFHRVPLMKNTQACWLLLLMCAATGANFWLRAVRPDQCDSFAVRHDTNVEVHWDRLTSAVRSREAAFWSSWANCPHDETAVVGIDQDPSPCFAAVRNCQGLLVAGLDIPSWKVLADTPRMLEHDADPTKPKRGWQHGASRCLNATPQEGGVVHPRKPKSGAPEIAAGPPSVSSIVRFAHKPGDPNRPTTFPSVVVQTPLSPTSSDFAHRYISRCPVFPQIEFWPNVPKFNVG